MTATREAIVLPASFLTVALLGGLRVAPVIRLVPPPLISLVLAMLLLAGLVRSGVFAPHAVLRSDRSNLENSSGLAVTLTLFAACAQVFTLVTPEQGLLHVVFAICFFVQLTTTLAGVKGRRNMLRSLVVLLGSAFILRFVVLEGLYAHDGGFAKRVITAMLEGASLGSIQYEPVGAGTGYVAFFTLALFFVGLILLPPGGPRGALRSHTTRDLKASSSMVLLVMLTVANACCGGSTTATAAEKATPSAATAKVRAREDALASARVWTAPRVPVSRFDFAANPSGEFSIADEVSCRFVVQKLSGRTQKFHCQLPDGRILKIKYGAQNAELQAEVAGTRLLRALGFGADEMFVIKGVRCDSCPRFPFQSLQCRERLELDSICFGGPLGARGVRSFATAVIERRFAGEVIEASDDEGWSWYELDKIDPSRGGSTRAAVDALRLLAVFLAHWDNKGSNQRLICPAGNELPDGGCRAPVAIIQDLGATFGPLRVDLPSWRAEPIWLDRATCTVSMATLPYGGATFPERQISEAGRLMLAGLLEQLSPHQLRDLFIASRMIDYDAIAAESRDPDAWVEAFLDKVKQVRDGDACPNR
jgi:hypothetical protein